jgi:hypothetical protein
MSSSEEFSDEESLWFLISLLAPSLDFLFDFFYSLIFISSSYRSWTSLESPPVVAPDVVVAVAWPGVVVEVVLSADFFIILRISSIKVGINFWENVCFNYSNEIPKVLSNC